VSILYHWGGECGQFICYETGQFYLLPTETGWRLKVPVLLFNNFVKGLLDGYMI